MISLRSLALATCLLVAPLAVMAADPDPATPPTAEDSAEPAEAKSDDTAAEDKRICRYVKLETASRRKTKVCRTTEEWRELNNPR
jgi:hypothetical protein